MSDTQKVNPESPRVQFGGFDCEVQFEKYQMNGRTGIILNDRIDGEEVAVATVNVPGVPLGKNEVLIKDYSENEGMLEALEKAGVVKATGRMVTSGFAQIPVAELLVEPPWEKAAREEAAGATYQRSAEQQEAAQRNAAEQAKGMEESQGKGLGK